MQVHPEFCACLSRSRYFIRDTKLTKRLEEDVLKGLKSKVIHNPHGEENSKSATAKSCYKYNGMIASAAIWHIFIIKCQLIIFKCNSAVNPQHHNQQYRYHKHPFKRISEIKLNK